MDPSVLLQPHREPEKLVPSDDGSSPENNDEMEATMDLALPETEGEPVPTTRPARTNEISVNLSMLEDMDINRMQVHPALEENAESSADLPFVVDVSVTTKNKPRLELDHNLAPVVKPAPASPPSSGEEIVFVPKKKRKSKTTPVHRKPTSRSGSPRRSIIPHPTIESANEFVLRTQPTVAVVDDPVEITTTTLKINPSNVQHLSKSQKKKNKKAARKENRARRASRFLGEDDDEEILADYIANTNMDELGTFSLGAGVRDLGGENMDVWLDVSEDEDDEDDENGEDDSSGDDDSWDEADMGDFDAISTSDEGKGVMKRILRKRQRPSGLQYLIKWEGTSTDDATWILAEALDSASDRLIKKFERREVLRQLAAEAESSSFEDEEDSGGDSGVDDGDDDGFDDDQALKDEKKAQEEADYRLARVLAGLDEDDDNDDNDDNDDDLDDDLDDYFVQKAGGALSVKPHKGKFPSASRVAKASQNNWDPMDWASPRNVAPKKKGKKSKGILADLELSDEELKARVRSHWEKDRNAKKARKAQREALRAEGLLGGGKAGKRDLHADFISVAALHKEITDFLMTDAPK